MNPYIPLIGVAISVIVGGAVMIYLVESPNEDAEITTMLDAFWWTVATITTVGYGDIVPVTDLGRTIAIFYMFFGITMAGVFLSIVGTRYYQKRIEKPIEKELSHAEKLILNKIEELENLQKESAKNLEKKLKLIEEKINQDNL